LIDTLYFPSANEKDKLHEEFLAYQIVDLPGTVRKAERVDVAWHLLFQITDPATSDVKFRNLWKVAKHVLVTFHSNTDCDLEICVVNKNKTEFRSNLSTKA
jgi:hypothetical protein